jgi:hypothetical protein
MDSPLPDDRLAAIKEALYANRKIEAIKLHRKSTGSGLLEAKNAIEKLDAELRAASPEKFVAERPRSGCLGVIALCVVMAGFIFWNIVR